MKKAWDDFLVYTKKSRNNIWKRYLQYVAGVVMLLGVGVALLLLVGKSEKPSTVVQNQMITPGTVKALLIFHSGSQVSLTDSTVFEQVVEQHSMAEKMDEETQMEYNTIIVPRGGEYSLALADGTRIKINSDSKLTFPHRFMGEERRVRLEGEALFDVVKDKEHPFIVKTDDMEVEALGTTFNVKAYEDDARIIATLFSGSVRVSAGRYNVILSPDEGAIWRRKSGKLAVRKLDNSNYAKMWRDNELVFSGETLEEIAVILNRMYNVQIVFKSDEIKKFRFTGVICNNSLDNIIELISLTSPITYKTVGDTIELNNR